MVVNKPQGMTSHDVVSVIRKKFNMRRVGHAGTLDPLATGVLIILLGESTRLFKKFESFDKAYRATLLLGTTTTTADIQGKILITKPYADVTEKKVEDILPRFTGETEQVPPMVSAVKVGGERLYKLARKGIEVERPSRKIRIDILKIINFVLPEVQISVECSKGTYIRQLAQDIGEVLGCGAGITQIQRTKVGPFKLDEAVEINDVSEKYIRQWESLDQLVNLQ